MDRTVLYRELVRLANPSEAYEKSVHTEIDAVTREARSIAASVRRLEQQLTELRPQYLATSGPHQLNEKQRENLDYEVRALLQAEQRRVRALEAAEKRRVEAEESRGTFDRLLKNPRAHGASETLSRHRQGVFYYLNQQLQRVSTELADIQRVRFARRRTHAVAATAPLIRLSGQNSDKEASTALQEGSFTLEPGTREAEAVAPAKQQSHMLLLQEEQDELMEELNANLNKAQTAEQSLRAIAELQAELGTHLETQAQQLQRLSEDISLTSSDVGGANLQLERAKKRNRRASRIVVCAAVTSGILLLFFNR